MTVCAVIRMFGFSVVWSWQKTRHGEPCTGYTSQQLREVVWARNSYSTAAYTQRVLPVGVLWSYTVFSALFLVAGDALSSEGICCIFDFLRINIGIDIDLVWYLKGIICAHPGIIFVGFLVYLKLPCKNIICYISWTYGVWKYHKNGNVCNFYLRLYMNR